MKFIVDHQVLEEKNIQQVHGEMWANQNEWQVACSSMAPGVWESSLFSSVENVFFI